MSKKLISKTVSAMLLTTMSFYTLPVFAFTKDETVYSNLDSKGNSYKTIVSTHLNNEENEKVINDLSDLLNIENTNGDEKFSKEGNNLIWDANGADIYYQGESQKELPIECNIKYELDGKEISADELAGRSGKVKITLEYINKDEHSVNINGKTEKLYTPFVVVAGTIIDNKNNSNIEISNGKLVNDGTKTIVLGLALPGMQESLDISKNTVVDIPNNIEITMDATDFEFNNIVTYVTPKIIEENDIEIFDKLDELYNQVNTIKQASKQIEAGANDLKDGTQELASGTTELKNGTSSAYSGASQISKEVNSSIKALSTDKSDALDEKTLKAIEAEAEKSSILTDKQKAQIIAQADGGIEAQKAMIEKAGIESAKQIAEDTALETALAVAKETASKTAMSTAKTLNPNIDAKTLQQIGKQAEQSAVLTNEQKKQIIAQADAGIESKEKSAIIKKQAVDNAKKIAEQTAVTAAQESATLSAKLTARTVAKEVANQVKSAATNKVISQMKTLSGGLNQLTNGLSTLNNGAQALDDGAVKLEEGATTLSEGISTFNKEAIDTICSYINGDLKGIQTRVEKLQELANEYNNFTMLNDGTEGNVKFIMIIDSIKKQESQTNKQEIILNDGKNEEKED